MTRSTQQEGKPTQKQRRGDPGVEPQQKGPHVDWHFWANQGAALWTFSQLKRNSARFGARRRRLPEGLLHATECSAPSANRHYYSLEMTGLETNSCPFQRAPRLLPQSVKRQPSMAVNRQSLRRSFRTFPSRYMVARVRLPLALEYQEVTTHTHTHLPLSQRPKEAQSIIAHSPTHAHTHTPTRIMHFCLTWPLTASAFWPLVMIFVNVTATATAIGIANYQLPGSLFLACPVQVTIQRLHARCQSPVLWSMTLAFNSFFSSSFFSLTRLSAVHCIHPHRTKRGPPTRGTHAPLHVMENTPGSLRNI